MAPQSPDDVEFTLEIAKVLKLLRKYECRHLLTGLVLCLSEHLEFERLAPASVFALASAAGASHLCINALGKAGREASSDLSVPCMPRRLESLNDSCALDPGSIPFRLAELIQPQHFWAWSRAWSMSVRQEYHNQCRMKHHFRAPHTVAAEFMILMTDVEKQYKS